MTEGFEDNLLAVLKREACAIDSRHSIAGGERLKKTLIIRIVVRFGGFVMIMIMMRDDWIVVMMVRIMSWGSVYLGSYGSTVISLPLSLSLCLSLLVHGVVPIARHQ